MQHHNKRRTEINCSKSGRPRCDRAQDTTGLFDSHLGYLAVICLGRLANTIITTKQGQVKDVVGEGQISDLVQKHHFEAVTEMHRAE